MNIDKKLKTEIYELEKKYIKSKIDYYRFVIRNEDKTILTRFGKIPDNWDDYQHKDNINLTDGVKSRLSDIKKKKSWELKLQSLYFFFITDIENKLITVFQQGYVDKDDLDEVIDSLSNLILEIDDELLNIKYLLLTLAKRSISDFYYLISAYCKFFLKRNFNYETDIKIILEDIIKIFSNYNMIENNIQNLADIDEEISSLFSRSSNEFGWRMNEFAVKDYFEKSNQALKIAELTKNVRTAYDYKKLVLNYYSFLKFYYNENEGKLFRLNFVHESLKNKLNENKISVDVFDSYVQIRESFISYKNQFEVIGLVGFGSEKITYYELLELTFKLCKIIEFYYLRNMKYESLQIFRNEILYYVEKEMLTLNG
ncbi:MAG: hypothetical protein CVV49_06060 [Spirochaetae bacterium HGW-Spirochaetae-5]|nr:MAG: hypothetical protein CVV49_06060 [Spirochaetae bacterium HGW-Spirochaetae-5]